MKVHVFAPNLVIDITYYWFEAGQKLVRSLSSIYRMDNANCADFLVRSRSIYFAYDGQLALSLSSLKTAHEQCLSIN